MPEEEWQVWGMNRRAELHTLVRQARSILEEANSGVLPGVLPASADDRAAFQAQLASRQSRKNQAIIESLGVEKPIPKPAPTAPVPVPKKSSGVPIWEQFGSKPAQTFRESVELEGIWEESDPHKVRLEKIQTHLGNCKRCGLCDTRTNIVFGDGDPDARLMFIGEAPGHHEDLQARPFVGKAGELLDKMIEAMGLTREGIYIANVIKCRPPENRNPTADEITKCEPFIRQQIAAVDPEVIVTLGKFGANTLLQRDGSLSQIRGTWQDFDGIPVMPTFHPAYLLRTPAAKRDAWADLQLVMKRLGL